MNDKTTAEIFAQPKVSEEFLNAPTLHEYEQVFGFNAKTLEGKRVLDLGSLTDNFSRSLKAIYPNLNVEVVSLDQARLDARVRKRSSHVEGKAQILPFKDNTFDLIFAHLSVPHWIFGLGENSTFNRSLSQTNEIFFKEMITVLDEAARVLKDGGEAKFSPWAIVQQIHGLSNRREFEDQIARVFEDRIRKGRGQKYKFFIDNDGLGSPMGHLIKPKGTKN